METRSRDRLMEDLPGAETPEDVAVLYSWANLHGAKYRDFSASRREYRAQLRHRAAEQARQGELEAQAEAEAAALEAEQLARQASSEVSRQPAVSGAREQARREGSNAARLAHAERIEAARRAEAAAAAELSVRREEREIAEAHTAAERQAAQYNGPDRRSAVRSDAENSPDLPGQISDPYTPVPSPSTIESYAQRSVGALPALRADPVRITPSRSYIMSDEAQPTPIRRVEVESEHFPEPTRSLAPAHGTSQRPETPSAATHRARGYRPDEASGVRRIFRNPDLDAGPEWDRRTMEHAHSITSAAPGYSESRPQAGAEPSYPTAGSEARSLSPHTSAEVHGYAPRTTASLPQREPRQPVAAPSPHPRSRSGSGTRTAFVRHEAEGYYPPTYAEHYASQPDLSHRSMPPAELVSAPRPAAAVAEPATGPAWIYEAAESVRPAAPMPPAPQTSVADTLQQSRERVASRWYALKGVFEQPGQRSAEPAPVRQKEIRTPVLAVFSLAGGVGKTSLAATLGRSLSALGEKVLLTDTTSHGLLPFYFGASELRQGTVRTFSPPSGSTDAPIYLVSYGVDGRVNDEEAERALAEEIVTNSRGMHRVLLDLNPNSGWLVRGLAANNPTILVPVAPDMNSVISLEMVNKLFAGVTNAEGRPVSIAYLLNHFDASLPLHLDVREVLRRQLGDKLLPFVIRRAPAISEALAEGMTVIDYSPDAPVAEDYLHVANWLRSQAAPAAAGFRNVRWSER